MKKKWTWAAAIAVAGWFLTISFVQAQPSATDAAGAPSVSVASSTVRYEVDALQSEVFLSLFVGEYLSPVSGTLTLTFGGPYPSTDVASRRIRVRVTGADMSADDWTPDGFLPEPLALLLDPHQNSVGWYEPYSGRIAFSLYLVNPDGWLPVPMPLDMAGTLGNAGLNVFGDNGPVADAYMTLRIVARPAPPVRPAIIFSTEVGFHIGDSAGTIRYISDGDMLSSRECLLRTNNQLTANLGIMPVVPDLGLDALSLTSSHNILFSLEQSVFSETLGPISHGDLLGSQGQIVRTNAQLVRNFGIMPIVPDVGLDAVHVPALSPAAAGIYFSTENGFFSERLGRYVGHGDLLREDGVIIMTNRELLRNFYPVSSSIDEDFGLDALYVFNDGSVWFSTEVAFQSATQGSILDGDLLSSRGYVVRRNLDLLNACAPLEDANNFGLDALDLRAWPSIAPAVSIADSE